MYVQRKFGFSPNTHTHTEQRNPENVFHAGYASFYVPVYYKLKKIYTDFKGMLNSPKYWYANFVYHLTTKQLESITSKPQKHLLAGRKFSKQDYIRT